MVFSMMQVQKGQVKYKDRSDIICTYGINDAGKQYYFLDGEKLSNGNLVASTALVEAIDPLVVASNIGVISPEGEIVIPFENKTIKPISDNAVLVEKVNPSTPSVIEAVNMRKDPLAATKLVTTPATIKDRVNAKMGNGGRFVFNDQFSEATVFDLNGKNLLNGEYYSFIGLNKGTLYMTKNTVDAEIVEYKLFADDKVKPASEELLDVQEAKVAPEVIDKAMQPEVPPVVAPAAPVIPEEKKEEAPKELHQVNFQAIEAGEDFKDLEIKNEEVFEEDKKLVLNKKPEKETRVSLFEGLKFEDETVDKFSTVSNMSNNSDTIIDDTAAMLSKLIKKNKEQREKLASYEAKLNDLLTFKRQAFNENQRLVKENDTLKKKLKEMEAEIANNSSKLATLNAQVARKDDLAKLLGEAQNLLED